jgi:hypothetical protein
MDAITPYRDIRLNVCKKQRWPGPQNCRTSRRAEDPVELTEYATFKEIHFLFGKRVWKCIAYSRREPPAQPAARVCAQNFSLPRGMIIRSCRILVCNPLKSGCAVPALLQFDVCEAIRAQTKEALAALGRHLSGITAQSQVPAH